ncbi:MAG: HAD family phosphatase [Verrucomicrobia bacterium]|nr:HAD family phosphatase [Verrucomicrobiota bacterium]
MIDTIIFDAEGVVIDTEPMWDKAQEEFLRRRGVAYDRDRLKHLFSGRSALESMEITKTECGISGDTQLLAAERTELVRRQLEEHVGFVTGFMEFFQRVRPAYKTCIATAMAEELLRIVDRRLGLSELFDAKIFSLAAVGFRSKPNPDLFLHGASQLGSKPETCLVIEDAPHGVEAARRAGMRCIAITTTYDRRKLSGAERVVDSFAEIGVI